MARVLPAVPRWFTQASAIASLGVAAIGCSGSTESPPARVDAGTPDATSDEPMTYYGPAPVDAGTPDATSDEPMAYYGPVPTDAADDVLDEEPAAYYGPQPIDAG